MLKINKKFEKYKKEVEKYYHEFTAGGFGKSRLTFYDESVENLDEELKNSSLACGNPVKYLEENPPEDGSRILDIGCGAGFELMLVKNRFNISSITGLDYSIDMIRKCQKNIEKFSNGGVFCIQGDGENLPFPDDSFDICISNAAINLIPDKNKAFNEIKRILKNNGRFIFSDVTILKDIPDQLKEKFNVMDGLYFAPTLINTFDEIDLVKEYFETVELLSEVDILPDKDHTEQLLNKFPKLKGKEKKFMRKGLMKAKYRVIEIEAKPFAKGTIDKIPCNCGKLNSAETIQIINLDESTLLFRKLLKGELNIYKCSKCGIVSALPVPVMICSDKENIKCSLFPPFLEKEKDMILMQLPPDEKCFFSLETLLLAFPQLRKYMFRKEIVN